MIDRSPTLVVCDAGPLIHLDELGCLDLLSDFSQVLVPETVWQEVGRHRPGALAHPGIGLQRVTPQGPEPPALEALAQVLSLHTGEWEALRVALEYRLLVDIERFHCCRRHFRCARNKTSRSECRKDNRLGL